MSNPETCYVGSIPGVPVGKTWMTRKQLSNSGVHKPLSRRIHFQKFHKVFSILLNYSHKEQKDNGDEILFIGCGKQRRDRQNRLLIQHGDQTLNSTRNRALASSCNVTFERNTLAAIADEPWENGSPIRVVRCARLKDISIYSPKRGYRYDGIYKIYKYFPTIPGFMIFNFLLIRDDPMPAPWETTVKIPGTRFTLMDLDDSESHRKYGPKKRATKRRSITSPSPNNIVLIKTICKRKKPTILPLPENEPLYIECADDDQELTTPSPWTSAEVPSTSTATTTETDFRVDERETPDASSPENSSSSMEFTDDPECTARSTAEISAEVSGTPSAIPKLGSHDDDDDSENDLEHIIQSTKILEQTAEISSQVYGRKRGTMSAATRHSGDDHTQTASTSSADVPSTSTRIFRSVNSIYEKISETWPLILSNDELECQSEDDDSTWVKLLNSSSSTSDEECITEVE